MSPAPKKSQPASDVILEVKDLVQRYNGRAVLNGLNFKVRRGETFVIMGGSGCGKTTLLRILIGAQNPPLAPFTFSGRTSPKHPLKSSTVSDFGSE